MLKKYYISEKHKKPQEYEANILHLFKYATRFDITLMVIGTLFAIFSGMCYPILGFYFGGMTNVFVNQAKYGLLPDEVAQKMEENAIANAEPTKLVFKENAGPLEFLNNNKIMYKVVYTMTEIFTTPLSNNDLWRNDTINGSPLTVNEFHDTLNKYFIIFLIMGVLTLISGFIQTMTWEYASEHQVHTIRKIYFAQILRQDISWYDKNEDGNLPNKLSDDLERIREGTGHKFVMIVQYLSSFFSGIIVGLYVNARMTLVTLCVGPFIIGLTAYAAKPPVKAEPWKGVLNATKPGARCIQLSKGNKEKAGSEDCLNLNIYAPLDAQPGDNIPVIVYIFGGIFQQNSNLDNGPQYMMDKRIIIVMPNYRLGALGFMSTGDTVIPGNMGMKDQVLALQWVNDNIHAFGGDPSQITLHGHSSGAMCVHLHTLSPSSVGLFNRVIIQSGIGNSPIGFFDRKVSRAVGLEFAQRLGCKHKSSNKILQCMLEQDANVFPSVQQQMYIWDLDPDAPFRPTVEVDNAESPFLTEVPPKTQYPLSNYEWLIGTTTGEGSYKAAGLLAGDGKLAQQLDVEYKKLFPISIQYLWTSNLKYVDYISAAIRKHYFGNESIDNSTAIPLRDMYTDGLFSYPTNEAIRKFKGTRYVYLYDYWSNYSTQNKRGYYPRIGISHAEELHLIFRHESSVPFLTDHDIDFGNELITRWVNFAYSGNPNKPFPINESMFSSWHPVTSSRIEYLQIKINGTMEKDYCEKSYLFWKNMPIFSKYYNLLPDPFWVQFN